MLQTARGGEEDERMHERALSNKEGEGYVHLGRGRLCPTRRGKAMSTLEGEGYVCFQVEREGYV